MARGSTAARATRVAGGTGLLAAVVGAAALTGAAFFTVNQASCGDPATYVRTDGQVELIGGCVDPADLPGSRPVKLAPEPAVESGLYQP